jgi:hypothetical protein
MDWTETGASPPILSAPTWICRVFRRALIISLLAVRYQLSARNPDQAFCRLLIADR